jgi:serine/threonine protein kinase
LAELQPGAAFAGYRIEALIGRGGMGLVYRAQDERLKRKVALKVLPPQKATDEPFRTRFIRESEAAASIDHPNIIPIFEAGEEADCSSPCVSWMGPDPKQYLAQQGPLSLDEATDLLDGVAGALDTAHAQGLVHRDIKPQNVLISMGPASVASRHVYLTDFGLMKEKEAGREVTAEGQFVGTIDYVAPSRWRVVLSTVAPTSTRLVACCTSALPEPFPSCGAATCRRCSHTCRRPHPACGQTDPTFHPELTTSSPELWPSRLMLVIQHAEI